MEKQEKHLPIDSKKTAQVVAERVYDQLASEGYSFGDIKVIVEELQRLTF